MSKIMKTRFSPVFAWQQKSAEGLADVEQVKDALIEELETLLEPENNPFWALSDTLENYVQLRIELNEWEKSDVAVRGYSLGRKGGTK